MQRRSEFKLFAMALAATAASLVCLLELRIIERVSYAMERGRLRALRDSLPGADRLAELAWAGRSVAEVVTQAVVSIETDFRFRQVFANHSQPSDDDVNDTIQERETPRLPDDGYAGAAPFLHQGLGSGVIIDADHGYIVTNTHVVDGAEHIRVYLHDGRNADAEVLGLDPTTDLAVLRVELPRLHALPLADSSLVRVGDDVFAVGNPFGLKGSVSKGIISAVDRRNVRIGGTRYRSLLQTDAVITPGSSGGPLVNLRGEIVGISTAMATNTGRYDGVGFAIPSAQVRRILGDLIEGGPGVLGVLVASVAAPEWKVEAKELGWTEAYGAVVTRVVHGMAAANAGLETEDIIFSVDDQRIDTHEHLADLIASTKPHTVVTLGLWRDQDRLLLPVRIGRRYAPR